MTKRLKRPRDPVQLAKLIGDIATGQVADVAPDDGKNPAAVTLGKLGGAKGGNAPASVLSSSQRRQIAAQAAATQAGKRGLPLRDGLGARPWKLRDPRG